MKQLSKVLGGLIKTLDNQRDLREEIEFGLDESKGLSSIEAKVFYKADYALDKAIAGFKVLKKTLV